ncbi:MAG TPA: hypothetical protein VNV44_01120 [Solirubrobacteraceae bacterium]|nr:hypothetical protein [Solirubrobacteraceae bacterium]
MTLTAPARTLLATVAVLLVGAVLGGCSSGGESASSAKACNGVPALCDRRVNQVFFAATHNSFAASGEPGWRFANQTYPIPRQLNDGIRALLIDVHYGVTDPANGRVRTDFGAEGADANKVAKQVPPEALRVADQIAGGIGLGNVKGTPRLYLCHTLCELGAEPLDRELDQVRGFLEGNPDQVLIMIVEDYPPAAAIASAFAKASLTRYAATLHEGAPLPTLGGLVSSGRRLLVFAENHGGTPAWYMPAFTFIEDTPLGAVHPGQLSCKRYRGEASSPLLLVNHWIPPFPPSTALNAQIGRSLFLRGRIEQCVRARGREGAITAVDFYQRTSVVEVTQQLNERAARR